MFGNAEPKGWESRYRVEAKGYYIKFRIGTWLLTTCATVYIFAYAPLPSGSSQPNSSSIRQ